MIDLIKKEKSGKIIEYSIFSFLYKLFIYYIELYRLIFFLYIEDIYNK